MIVAGVDPGTSPTIALVDGATGRIGVYDGLSAARRVGGRDTFEPVPERICLVLEAVRPDRVVLERVWMRPTGGAAPQGAVSQARLVASMYLIWGIAVGLGLEVELVLPQVWKTHFRLRGDKEASRRLALRLIPESAPFLTRKLDHNRAEALLLAQYGLDRSHRRAAE